MTPMPFQEATAQAALAVLTNPDGPRRYLVADEVGLGKTVVARRVMQELMAREPRRTLHVLYVCSNLVVAGQNRKSLLGCLPDENHRKAAVISVDRLGLIPGYPEINLRHNSAGARPLRLFTLTPGTSLPDFAGGRVGSGNMKERALVQALLERAIGSRLPDAALQMANSKSWAWRLEDARNSAKKAKLPESRTERFGQLFAQLAGLPAQGWAAAIVAEAKQPLLTGKARRPHPLRTALWDRLGALRAASCLLALELLDPDLVIFDEFQRFSELLKVKLGPDKAPRQSALVAALRGDSTPVPRPLLLLSATPYRLTKNGDEASAHQDFLAVTRFLLGATLEGGGFRAAAGLKTETLQGSLAALHTAFLTGAVTPEAQAARNEAENVLKSVMARTERSDERPPKEERASGAGQVQPIETRDLLVFRHLVDLAARNKKHPSAQVCYWSSIPLPSQTMSGYESARVLQVATDPKPPPGAYFTKKTLQALDVRPAQAHPRLRSLHHARAGELQALPWVAPSQPWWNLQGGWAEGKGGPAKILAFGRFRAVPRSVPPLLSHAAEAAVFAADERPPVFKGKFESGWKASIQHFAMFVPCPELAKVCDPLAVAAESKAHDRNTLLTALTAKLRKFLDERLKGRLVVASTARASTPSELLARLVALDTKQIGLNLSLSVAPRDQGHVDKWLGEGKRALKLGKLSIRAADLGALAEVLAFGPANILWRCVNRHHPGDQLSGAVAELAWGALRSRLGHPVALAALRLSGGPRSAPRLADKGAAQRLLLRAAYDGNLEAVIDEHLWCLSRQEATFAAAFAEFKKQCEALRGQSEFATAGAGKVVVRCHVAMPFRTESTARSSAKADELGADQADRPDLIRNVFNSPFWPHILVTTSVGQEGLDFHPWCMTIAHWDLPGNPVDYEQREGRIQRYAGLSVRRGIAASLEKRRRDILVGAVKSKESPWAACIREVELGTVVGGKGLTPWWTFPGSDIVRLFPTVEGSEVGELQKQLDRERELYRLVLGQPDQAQLVARLLRSNDEEMATLRLRLSPAYGSR